MSDYEYWFDGEGKAHKIIDMDEQYIYNCLNQLLKMHDFWGVLIPEQLTDEELKDKDEIGMKAWFAFNGVGYMEAFTDELARRKEKFEDGQTNI